MFQQFGRPVLSVNQLLSESPLTTDRFLARSRLNLWVVAKISFFVFTAIRKTNPETSMTLIAWFEKSLPLSNTTKIIGACKFTHSKLKAECIIQSYSVTRQLKLLLDFMHNIVVFCYNAIELASRF